jgi:hypothetical protein
LLLSFGCFCSLSLPATFFSSFCRFCFSCMEAAIGGLRIKNQFCSRIGIPQVDRKRLGARVRSLELWVKKEEEGWFNQSISFARRRKR